MIDLRLGSARGVVLDSCRIRRNTGEALLAVEGASKDISLPGTEIR